MLHRMTHRMIAAMLLLAVLAVASASSARAQTVSDAGNTMRAMTLRMRALNSARKQLQQIESHRDDREADATRDITDADVRVFAEALKVYTVAFMLTGMKCPEDVGFAQQQFGLVVKAFVTTADEELPRLNENLHDVATPGALTEADNIRDVIVDMRNFLKPFATRE
jgi:hypothetical protein